MVMRVSDHNKTIVEMVTCVYDSLIKTVLHMAFMLYFPFQISDSYIYNYIILMTF